MAPPLLRRSRLRAAALPCLPWLLLLAASARGALALNPPSPPPSVSAPLVSASSVQHSWTVSGSSWTDGGASPITATLYGGVTVLAGTGLRFPGTSGSYACMPALPLGGSDTTIAVWAYYSAWSQGGRVFDLGVGNSGSQCTAGDTSNYVQNCMPSSGTSMRVEISNSGSFVNNNAPLWALNTWTHVVVSIKLSTSLTTYVNGASQSSLSWTNNQAQFALLNTARPFYSAFLGKSQYSADPYFPGLIAAFQTYGYALSASQVCLLSAAHQHDLCRMIFIRSDRT